MITMESARILIVDDEPANLKLLDKMLSAQGYSNLVLIQDSRQVLESYRQERTDLILLDINMPHIDGFGVMEQLKALQDPLFPPVVVLTAQHSQDFLLRALNLGARDFLSKPFDRNELLARVRNMLDAQLAYRLLHDQKAVLDEIVRARTEELRRTQLQVVQRLGRAVEYRDNETGNHILRMSHISALLAKSMGLSEAECELILHASPMHDIGKIGISDHILLKPGRLESEEWAIMQSHATIGAHILEGDDSDLIRCAREIALTHHEKWDGSGYPYGLAGDMIPLMGRIAALADVFDALASERPYKKAWTIDEAVNLIKENRGTHFDPELVDVFLMQLSEILKIREQFSDAESVCD